MSESAPSRQIELANMFNLRDLGGYPTDDGRRVRWRRLFRADGLHRLGPADLPPLMELGISTVIDLRRPDEVEVARLEAAGLTRHHYSVQPFEWESSAYDESVGTARFLADRYLEMTTHRGRELGSVLRLIADSSGAPLAFHCAAGKDRTGVVAALTLALLQVPDDHISADYALSAGSSDRWLEWARLNRPELAAMVAALPGPWLDAPAQAIELFLADLRAEHGSVEQFATSVGVGVDAVERMRGHLLES